MSSLRTSIAAFFILVATASVGRAELIYVHYEGVLGSVPLELSSAFTPGDIVKGDFSFDPNVLPRDGFTEFSAVYDNLSSFSIQIGSGYLAKFANSLDGREIQIDDGTDTNELTDRILVLGLQSSGLVGPEVNGFVIESAGPHLEDSTNQALNGIGIPFGKTLSDFDFASIGITFTSAITATGDVSATDLLEMDARLTSIEFLSQPVPEPSTIAMLATGAVTLVGVVIRRRRSRAN